MFRQSGIKDFDSLHLALAEACGVDAFLTTDDRLLRAARQLDLKIKVVNPVSWLKELGTVGAINFIRQFSAGQGDYTAACDKLLEGISIDDIVKGICERDKQHDEK